MIKHKQWPRQERRGPGALSTWSVPGTTSNTLSWLRVSRMYRSFSGHISGHVPTKVLALSRSVLFTRAARRELPGTQRGAFHGDNGEVKRKTNTHILQRKKEKCFKALGLRARTAWPIVPGSRTPRTSHTSLCPKAAKGVDGSSNSLCDQRLCGRVFTKRIALLNVIFSTRQYSRTLSASSHFYHMMEVS